MRTTSADRRSPGAFFLLSLSAAVLGLMFFALFFRIETIRQRSQVEYRALQIQSALVDVYHTGMAFNPDEWPEVSGFGMYSVHGESLFRYGSAPDSLDRAADIPLSGTQKIEGSAMTIVRRMGSAPGVRPMMQGRMRNAPMMQGRQNMPLMSGQPQYSWIEINISGSLSQSRWALFLLALFVSVFALVVLLAVYNARKLSEYRERERTSFHLVQLGEAARTLAHEIKNPLGVIRLQCATLRRTVPEDRLRNIDIIEEETARLAGLSDRIREFLDNSDGTPELVHTGAILNRLRERYGDRLSVAESSGGNLLVYIDPDRLMQILDNLVSNAFDAGGSEPPMLGLETSRSLLLFTVSDSGPGVAPEHRSRLFELFFTTKTKGSGIGLALAAKYAKQAGGAVAYAPRTGGGSIFTLSLPASGGTK